MTAMMRVPRTRGAGSGLLLILLGAWGALIPFVGPYFHFAYTPDTAWAWTWGRFFLEIVPGVACRPRRDDPDDQRVPAGRDVRRGTGRRCRRLVRRGHPARAGVDQLSTLGVPGGVPAALDPGQPTGGPLHMVAEHLSFFTALGVVIVFLAAVAFGRLAVVGARDAALAAAQDEVAWSKPGRRARREEKQAKQDKPVTEGRRAAERVAAADRGAVTGAAAQRGGGPRSSGARPRRALRAQLGGMFL